MFENVNLEEALQRERARSRKNQSALMREVNSLFVSEWEAEREILRRLTAGSGNGEVPQWNAAKLNPENIYHITDIRKLCINYRLRFLDSGLFEGNIPAEAVAKVKQLEREHNTTINRFKIMAPGKVFKLTDAKADPLLFAPIDGERFLLIHKWGTDLAWYRRMLSLPVRNFASLVACVVLLSAILALFVPTSFLTPTEHAPFVNGFRILFFAWSAVFLSGVMSYIWFASNRQFSASQWNSKFYND